MIRFLFSVIVVVAILLALWSCGNNNPKKPTEPRPDVVQLIDTPAVALPRATPFFAFDSGNFVVIRGRKGYFAMIPKPAKPEKRTPLFDFSKDKSKTEITVVIGNDAVVGDRNKDKSEDKTSTVNGNGNDLLTADRLKDNTIGDGNTTPTQNGLNPLWLLGLLVLIVAILLLYLYLKAKKKAATKILPLP